MIVGEVDDDINFAYDTNTEVYGSCAASLNGKMFVLGGWNQRKQVNIKHWQKIVTCIKHGLDKYNSRLQLDKCWRNAF